MEVRPNDEDVSCYIGPVIPFCEWKREEETEHAIVWLVMKDPSYLVGAMVSAASVRDPYNRVLMVTADIDLTPHESSIRAAFTHIYRVSYIKQKCGPLLTAKQRNMYHSWMDASFTKWNCLALPYKKVLFIDADTVILRSLASLFDLQAPAGNFDNPWIKRSPYERFCHGDIIPRSVIENYGLYPEKEAGFVCIGSTVLLSPDTDTFYGFVEWLMSHEEYQTNSYSMHDETAIVGFFIASGHHWTQIDTRFNTIPWKLDPSRRSLPVVLHYFNKGKPWTTRISHYDDLEVWYAALNLLPDLKETIDPELYADPIEHCCFCDGNHLPSQCKLFQLQCSWAIDTP